MAQGTAFAATPALWKVGARRLRPASVSSASRPPPPHHSRWVASASSSDTSNIDAYNAWVADQQVQRNKAATSSNIAVTSVTKPRVDTASPPSFPHPSLFHPGAEEYACDMTRLPSEDFATIARETERANLFAPCMVGAVEGQFLKMIAQINRAKRVLDIGTFTGYSALAFAEGVGEGGSVITIEADHSAAEVARKVFAKAKHGGKIKLLETDARKEVEEMANRGEKYDIVFLDADKTNYRKYYEDGLKMLNDDGLLMADNALCSLVYTDGDPVRQSLHDFAQFVRNDPRVEQVMLTVREGILLVRKA